MILLDTQAVAWLAQEPERLSAKAVRAIERARAEDGLSISDKTLWELAMMYARGRMDDSVPLRDILRETERNFVVLAVNAAIAETSVRFGRNFPGDPADRLIAATALVYGLTLVTSDTKIRQSGEIDCIW